LRSRRYVCDPPEFSCELVVKVISLPGYCHQLKFRSFSVFRSSFFQCFGYTTRTDIEPIM
jgi:hypothetical protein